MKAYLALCAGIPTAGHLLLDTAHGEGSLLIAGLAGVVVAAMFTLDLARERHVHEEVLLLLRGLAAGSTPADATAPLDVLTTRAHATTGRRIRWSGSCCGTCGSHGTTSSTSAT